MQKTIVADPNDCVYSLSFWDLTEAAAPPRRIIWSVEGVGKTREDIFKFEEALKPHLFDIPQRLLSLPTFYSYISFFALYSVEERVLRLETEAKEGKVSAGSRLVEVHSVPLEGVAGAVKMHLDAFVAKLQEAKLEESIGASAVRLPPGLSLASCHEVRSGGKIRKRYALRGKMDGKVDVDVVFGVQGEEASDWAVVSAFLSQLEAFVKALQAEDFWRVDIHGYICTFCPPHIRVCANTVTEECIVHFTRFSVSDEGFKSVFSGVLDELRTLLGERRESHAKS